MSRTDRASWRYRIAALGSAAVFGTLFITLYVVADRTLVGQRVDDWTFLVVFDVVPGGWPVKALAWFARNFVVVAMAILVAVLASVALFQRRWNAVLRAVAVVSASVLLTPYLRDEVLVRARLQAEPFPFNSLPSTHAAAAVSLTIAVVMLWPSYGPRPWWVDRIATVVVVLVALGNIISQAHRPGDVAASFLLVGAVAAVVEAAMADAPAIPRPPGTAAQ